MTDTYTNCRSEEGITVGLIDSIITAARVAVKRKLDSDAVRQALRDMQADEDVKTLLTTPSHEQD